MNSEFSWPRQPNGQNHSGPNYNEFQSGRFRKKPQGNFSYNPNFANNQAQKFQDKNTQQPGFQSRGQSRNNGHNGNSYGQNYAPFQGFPSNFPSNFPSANQATAVGQAPVAPFQGRSPAPFFQSAAPQPFFQPAPQPKSAFAAPSAFGSSSGTTLPPPQPKNMKASPFTTVPSGAAQPRSSKKKEIVDEKPTKKERRGRRNANAASSVAPKLPSFPRAAFVGRQRPASNDNAILKPLPKPLMSVNGSRDEWDVQNQQQMVQIEQQLLNNQRSLQSAYEQMSKMRDAERQEMEKRGLVDSTEIRKTLSDAITFVGSCVDMCPVFERVRRTYENNVMSLEKNQAGKIDRDHAVKAFSRPAAGQPPPLPSDVRPPSVLVSTLNYLVSDMVPKLPGSHPFLWDRTRSIRQDFTYQNYQGSEALWCFEIIARIHCVSLHRMAKAVSLGDEWSQQQELEQFHKCLQSLSEFYQLQPLVSSNEAEMRAYQLLAHFFDDEIASSIDRLPYEISRHPLVLLALELRSLAVVSPTEFFHRLRRSDVPVTFRAILEVHFNSLRMRAIRQLVESMHKRMSMYSMARFVGLLGFESSEKAKVFCDHFDLIVSSSAEGGEEVDIRSWDEANVKDKQPLGQAFDSSLDPLIEQYNVLNPPSAKGAMAPIKPVATRFNVSAPAFTPMSSSSSSPAFSTGAAAPSAPAPDNNNNSNDSAQRLAEIKAKEAELRAVQEQQRQQKAAEESARQRQLLEQQRQQKLREEQQQAEAERLRQQQLQQSMKLEQERQKQAELAEQYRQRSEMRASYIQETAHHLLSHIIRKVGESDSSAIVLSFNMGKERVLKQVIQRVKATAQKVLQSREEQQRRDQELQTFRQARRRERVVSSRRAAPPDIHLDDGVDSVMEVDNDTFGAQKRQLGAGPKATPVTPLDMQSLVPALKKAFALGLTQIRVAADWDSSNGRWLRDALQLDRSVALDASNQFRFVSSDAANHFDVVLVDDSVANTALGHGDLTATTKSGSTHSLLQLRNDIESLLGEFVPWYQAQLSSHRSLNIKRRRLVNPKQRPSTAPAAFNQQVLPIRPSKPAAVAQAQKLRAMILEAQRLTGENVP